MKGIKIFSLFFIFCLLSGCSGVKEVVKGFVGVSTKVLEDARQDSLKKDFKGDLATTHKKIRDILSYKGAYVYRDDLTRNLIALYVSGTDTTPVGVFLTKIDKFNTQIEVSSPSTYGKEFIAGIIFGYLDKPVDLKDKKGKIDAEKPKFGFK